MRHDPDGGEAYTNRVVTLAVLFLGAVTVLLVVAAPWVMRPLPQRRLRQARRWPRSASRRSTSRATACRRSSSTACSCWSGQILNARGRFGPMMWAPIANNVIAVGVLVVYLVAFGPATAAEQVGGFTTGQELLLGSRLDAGHRRPVPDPGPLPAARPASGSGRGSTSATPGWATPCGSAIWTVLFVIVNQIAYTVVVRLASSGTRPGASPTAATAPATPSTRSTFLIVMVPHSVVTVSLATAILPRLSQRAADGDLPTLARTLGLGLRTALAVVIPFAAAAADRGRRPRPRDLRLGRRAATTTSSSRPTLALFGIGLVFFTVHYLMLRGFYALELHPHGVLHPVRGRRDQHRGRDRAGPRWPRPRDTAPALVLAYTASYAVGSAVSFVVLRRLLGGLETRPAGALPGPAALAALPASRRGAGARPACSAARGTTPRIWQAALRLFVRGAGRRRAVRAAGPAAAAERGHRRPAHRDRRLAPRRGGTTSA